MNSIKLGFVGLGTMGAPMARHLVRAGHHVTVWNRSPEKSAPFLAEGILVAPSLPVLAGEVDICFLCVNRSEDVVECIEAMAPHAAPGTLFVDHSTIAPGIARKIQQDLFAEGHSFLDAPITGGSMGAQSGTLTIFCGGAIADYERALPFLKAYAKRAERVGGSGTGQMMKLANQIAVGGALQALCESLAFAKKAGLDVAQARELLAGGAAGSWAFDHYGPKILSEDWTPGFSIKNQRKDFSYCIEEAEAIDAAIPGTIVVDTLLEQLEEEGQGELASCLLYELLARVEKPYDESGDE
ncbi:MAG: NAD(P)-dependent oxidoreductase [Armatimonadetes bacterium]|nr:NAD(P)-dependent oxidoreductase [Armatimonadota bacterium]